MALKPYIRTTITYFVSTIGSLSASPEIPSRRLFKRIADSGRFSSDNIREVKGDFSLMKLDGNRQGDTHCRNQCDGFQKRLTARLKPKSTERSVRSRPDSITTITQLNASSSNLKNCENWQLRYLAAPIHHTPLVSSHSASFPVPAGGVQAARGCEDRLMAH